MEPVLIHKIAQGSSYYEEYLPSGMFLPYVKRYTFLNGFTAFSGIKILPVSTNHPELVFHYAGSNTNISEINQNSQLVNFSKGYILNMHKLHTVNSFVLHAEIHSMNVILSTHAVPVFLGIPYQHLDNYRMDLIDILGNSGNTLINNICNASTNLQRIKMLEEYFMYCLRKKRILPDKIIPFLRYINSLHGNTSIDQMANEFNISGRTIERIFAKNLHMSPKEFIKIARFNYACALMKYCKEIDYQQIVYECGYFDQSHFIHEFKQIMKNSPRQAITKNNGMFYLRRAFLFDS